MWSKNQRSIPDPGVDAPLNKVLGSNSIPRVFLTDRSFLFENPKEGAYSEGSFRFEVGVAITGVAEENTGKTKKQSWYLKCISNGFFSYTISLFNARKIIPKLERIDRSQLQSERRFIQRANKNVWSEASLTHSHMTNCLTSRQIWISFQKAQQSGGITAESSCSATGRGILPDLSTYRDFLTGWHLWGFY